MPMGRPWTILKPDLVYTLLVQWGDRDRQCHSIYAETVKLTGSGMGTQRRYLQMQERHLRSWNPHTNTYTRDRLDTSVNLYKTYPTVRTVSQYNFQSIYAT